MMAQGYKGTEACGRKSARVKGQKGVRMLKGMGAQAPTGAMAWHKGTRPQGCRVTTLRSIYT